MSKLRWKHYSADLLQETEEFWLASISKLGIWIELSAVPRSRAYEMRIVSDAVNKPLYKRRFTADDPRHAKAWAHQYAATWLENVAYGLKRGC